MYTICRYSLFLTKIMTFKKENCFQNKSLKNLVSYHLLPKNITLMPI